MLKLVVMVMLAGMVLPPCCRAASSSYRPGEWIGKTEFNLDDREPVMFRTVFSLPDKSKVISARVMVTADDDATLMVNGQLLPPGPFHDNWALPDSYDIKDYLKNGENVLGVKTINAGGAAGLLLDAVIRQKEGAPVHIATDKNWQWSKDGKEWTAVESLGAPPVLPWGEVEGFGDHPEFGFAIPIPNAGLEDGPESPVHWSSGNYNGGTGRWSWETQNVHEGKRAFRICKDTLAGESELMSDFLPVEPGKAYEASAWVKLNRRTNATVYFRVSQYGSTPDTVQGPDTLSTSISLSGPIHYSDVVGSWRKIQAVFTVRAPNTRVRIHALAGGGSCDVTWDDFRLGPPVKQPVNVRFEPVADEIVPPLEPARKRVAARKRAEAHMEVQSGRPRLVVDGKPTAPVFLKNSPWGLEKQAQIGDFKKAGTHIYDVAVLLGRGVYSEEKGVWLGAQKYDFSEIDRTLWRVLRVDPEAYILISLICDPYRDWGVEHPDEVTQDQNGLKAIVDTHLKRYGGVPKNRGERFGPSLVSEPFRQEAAETLRQVVAYIRQSEPGKAVIGYHIAGASDAQWFQWADWSPTSFPDYSPGAQRSFRNWLRRLYQDDVSAFRLAWARPTVTFDTAAVPDAGRFFLPNRFVIDAKTDQDVIDYNRFLSEGPAETVLYLAQALREATGGKAVLGTYCEDISSYIPICSHLALGRYLESNVLDFFTGPTAYLVRLPGQCGAGRSVFGSTLLHGKLWFNEEDLRSWHSTPSTPNNNQSWGRAETAGAFNAMVRRESGMMLTYGMGLYMADADGGWFRDDDIMKGIAESNRAFEQDLAVPGIPRADMAVFLSEESEYYLYPQAASSIRIRDGQIVRQIYDLNTSGVPYRLYLLSDLGRLKLPEHRVYLFVNAYQLDAAQLTAIEALRRDGKLLIFLHAPGIANPRLGRNGAEIVERVTGIKVRAVSDLKWLGAEPVETNNPLLADLRGYLAPTTPIPGRGVASLETASAWPVFEITDGQAVSLATYPGASAVSVAYKKFSGHQVVLAGCFDLSDRFLYNLAKSAGAWCAAKPGDAVYANENFATIHALSSGHKTLALARPSKVVDLTTGNVMAERTETIPLEMLVGETRWFRLIP